MRGLIGRGRGRIRIEPNRRTPARAQRLPMQYLGEGPVPDGDAEAVAEEVGRHCLAHDAQAQEPHLHLCCLLPPSPALFSPKLASAHGTPWQAPSRPMLDFLYVFMGFFFGRLPLDFLLSCCA